MYHIRARNHHLVCVKRFSLFQTPLQSVLHTFVRELIESYEVGYIFKVLATAFLYYFLYFFTLNVFQTADRLFEFYYPQARYFPGGASGKEPACQCRRCKRLGFDP